MPGPPPPIPRENVGRTLGGKYRLTGRIGKGASATVYRGRNEDRPGMVAIKLFKPGYLKRAGGVDRFFREASIIARLDHPAVVRLLDWGFEDGEAFMVMEHVRGHDLKDLMAATGEFEPKRACSLAATLCDAIAAASNLDIVHRDLKPSNVRVLPRIGQADEQVKILDFGVAKLNPPATASARTIPKQLTAPGILIGTPKYMSPEQAKGSPLDTRSDLYAVAVILYELLTARVPIFAPNPIDLAISVAADPPTPIRNHLPNIDEELEATVMQGLAKRPEDRLPTPSVFRDTLRLLASRL